MRSGVFLLGVSLSAFSVAYGAGTVQLYDSTVSGGVVTQGSVLDAAVNPATIAKALTEARSGGSHPTTNPYIVLTGDVTETTGNTLPSTTTSLTIKSDTTGTKRTIQRTGAGSFTLLNVNASVIPLTLSNLTISGFSNASGSGGAIRTAGDVTLTDAQFTNNTATTSGGAVFTQRNVTYNVTNSVTLDPYSPTSSRPAGVNGDNDIAGSDQTYWFTLNPTGAGKTGTLTLNTNNLNWLGSTKVNAGSLIIGGTAANAATAQWAQSGTAGTIEVLDKATLGGFGTIYAGAIQFQSGSTWQLGIDPNNPTIPRLTSTGALNLYSGTIIDATQLSTIALTSGVDYPMATYTIDRVSSRLTEWNNQLASSYLILSQTGSGPYTLMLTYTGAPNIVRLNVAVPVNYPSINAALTGASASTNPTLTFTTAADTVEAASVSLDSFTGTAKSVTITGTAGGTTIIPASGFTSSLFINQNDNPLTLNLSNLTFSGFSNHSPAPDGNGSVLYVNGNGALTLSGSGPVTFTNNSSGQNGGAIGCISSSDLVTVTISCPVNFTGNRSTDMGGAIFGSAVTISEPAIFTGNGSGYARSGGAIFGSTVTISKPAIFTGNSTGSTAFGGGIYSSGNITLTDTQFANNTAGTSGGAVYAGGDVTYNVTTAVTLNPQYTTATLPAGINGDNDIAGVAGKMFTLNPTTGKTGTLTLNTNNLNWRGNTTVSAGRFIIGGTADNAGAIWGTTGGDIYVGYSDAGTTAINSGSATLGGFGSIYAKDIKFASSVASGPTITWLIGINSVTQTCGSLIMSGNLQSPSTLTLPTNIEIDGLVASDFPSRGYTVAMGYGNSLSGSLDTLNAKLAKYNVTLTESSNPPFSLTLTELPPGLYFSDSLDQNVLVTFEVPGFYNGRAITKYGEGLVVWCGVVWCGVVWCGVVWCGVVWCGVVKRSRCVRSSRELFRWNER